MALHAAAAVVLFLALARLTGGVWSSAFVAGVFALHPLHVHAELPAVLLESRLDRPLAALGAAHPTSVRIRGERGAVLHHQMGAS